jgi:hypothetical protein
MATSEATAASTFAAPPKSRGKRIPSTSYSLQIVIESEAAGDGGGGGGGRSRDKGDNSYNSDLLASTSVILAKMKSLGMEADFEMENGRGGGGGNFEAELPECKRETNYFAELFLALNELARGAGMKNLKISDILTDFRFEKIDLKKKRENYWQLCFEGVLSLHPTFEDARTEEIGKSEQQIILNVGGMAYRYALHQQMFSGGVNVSRRASLI